MELVCYKEWARRHVSYLDTELILKMGSETRYVRFNLLTGEGWYSGAGSFRALASDLIQEAERLCT